MNLNFYKSNNLPEAATEGSVWFDSSTKTIKLKNQSDWAQYSLSKSDLVDGNILWGGDSTSNSFGPFDACLVPDLGANRLQFFPSDHITLEYSRDGGETWVIFDDPTNASLLFTNNAGSLIIGNSSEVGIDKSNYMLRITLDTNNVLYTDINKFVVYISTRGSIGCHLKIEGQSHANVINNVDSWDQISNSEILGWSGYNVINNIKLCTYGNSIFDSNIQNLRFTFWVDSHLATAQYPGLTVYRIMGFGGVGWQCPSVMARTGHLYSFDQNQNAIFSQNVLAKKFILNGGPSTIDILLSNGSTMPRYTCTTKDIGEDNIYRNIWFSDAYTDSHRVYNTNFQYNPYTNTTTTNITGTSNSSNSVLWAEWED